MIFVKNYEISNWWFSVSFCRKPFGVSAFESPDIILFDYEKIFDIYVYMADFRSYICKTSILAKIEQKITDFSILRASQIGRKWPEMLKNFIFRKCKIRAFKRTISGDFWTKNEWKREKIEKRGRFRGGKKKTPSLWAF